MSSKEFSTRFLKLQRDVFKGEQKKQRALEEIRRIVGNGFASAIEALATTPRISCTGCGRDYMTDEIGESGVCTVCYNKDEQPEG